MNTLESSKLFGRLPAEELQSLMASAKEMRFAQGQEIFKEGDPGDGVYVVKSGEVAISAVVGSGQRHAFSKVQPGDFFGEMAVLDNQPRSACASAEGEVELHFVPREQMVALLTRSPELCITLLQEISRRVREFNQQYINELLQSERMALVGRFASAIVHDLKNPLTIIGIGAELACLDTATAEDRRTSGQRIARQIERITGMVNDILDFTRGTGGKATFAPTYYPTLVQSLVDELRREVERKSVSIEFENPPPPISLQLNPKRLSRVFYNLVLNAVDEMPGGGTIRLRFRTTENEVVTEVADSGGGIAPEILDTLFEPFATFGKVKGTGLGLSISQRIVQEHGGRIWAANQAGSGAVFSFTLPYRQP
jgi:signal transduction histidine kinase